MNVLVPLDLRTADSTVAPTPRRSPVPLMLHIGLHKKASTWLQRNIFSAGDHGYTSGYGGPRHQLIEHFVRPDPLFYDPEATAARYGPHVQAARDRALTLVMSHERFFRLSCLRRARPPDAGGAPEGDVPPRHMC